MLVRRKQTKATRKICFVQNIYCYVMNDKQIFVTTAKLDMFVEVDFASVADARLRRTTRVDASPRPPKISHALAITGRSVKGCSCHPPTPRRSLGPSQIVQRASRRPGVWNRL